MKWAAAPMLGLAVSTSLHAQPAPWSTENLVRGCRMGIAVQDQPARLDDYQHSLVMTCLGVVRGATEQLVYLAAIGVVGPHACVPAVSVAQAVRVVVKFYDDNPNTLHLPFAFGIHTAMTRAFPCPNPHPPPPTPGRPRS